MHLHLGAAHSISLVPLHTLTRVTGEDLPPCEAAQPAFFAVEVPPEDGSCFKTERKLCVPILSSLHFYFLNLKSFKVNKLEINLNCHLFIRCIC